jgi:anti-sigma B factor antagonist
MTLRVKNNDTEVVLEVAGAIRIYSSAQFRTALLELLRNPDNKHVVVDLSQVDYVDSSGLAVFVEGLKESRKKQATLVLRGVQESLRYLLEVTRLLPLFQLEDVAS